MSIYLELSNRKIKANLASFVMGIINVTPDSFNPNSRFFSLKRAILQAKKMIEEGVDIIDIGGESSRPGSNYTSEKKQISRIVPLIKKIRDFSNIPISIDTRSFEVAKASFEAGANIVNDISALEDDPRLVSFIAKNKLPVILMHKQGTPKDMQANPQYKNVIPDIKKYLESRIDYALKNGVSKNKIIIDPGIGFGKDHKDNIKIIKNLLEFEKIGYPVLIGLSSKAFIGQITSKKVKKRDFGTNAANMIAVKNGAKILRVHNVGATIDMLKVLKEIG